MIRRASLADAREIARVHHASRLAGNAPHLPEPTIAENSVERRQAAWELHLMADDAWDAVAHVAEEEDRIVGVASAGPTRDEDLRSGFVGHLFALYVDPERWRRGHGGALLDAALATLGERGLSRAVLWVLSANGGARGFYERRGWRLDGAQVLERDRAVHKVRYGIEPGRPGGRTRGAAGVPAPSPRSAPAEAAVQEPGDERDGREGDQDVDDPPLP